MQRYALIIQRNSNANIVIIVSDFQQNYVEAKALRIYG